MSVLPLNYLTRLIQNQKIFPISFAKHGPSSTLSKAKSTMRRDMSIPNSPRRTNGMAIAGFICSFLCWPLGLIFSILGMSQTSKDPSQGGRGLAIAGLVISIVSIVLTIILWVRFALLQF